MSDSWDHAQNLAKQLRRELPEDGEVAATLASTLERSVAVALARRRRESRRRRAAVALGSLLAAAAVLVAVSIPRHHDAAGHAVQLGKLADGPTLLEGTLAEPGQTADATRTVGTRLRAETSVLRSGPLAVIRLTPSSHLELKSAQVVVESFGKTAAFVLEDGSITASTQDDGERIEVSTPEVRASGRRASFEVERHGSECGRTRVVARSGTVEVRSARGLEILAPGASWSDCASALSPPLDASVHERSSEASLERQNEVFSAAVVARREGRTDEALRTLADFLRRWPHGPLSEVARAERMTILATVDPNAARAAARDYIHFHPNGAAVERARRLAGEEQP